eukprot:4961364-Amphidinium_carterae.1
MHLKWGRPKEYSRNIKEGILREEYLVTKGIPKDTTILQSGTEGTLRTAENVYVLGGFGVVADSG